jgi:hypothetical protein
MEKVKNPTKVDNLLELIKPAFKGKMFATDWLEKKNWIAVPVPDTIGEESAKKIAEMSSFVNEEYAFAIPLEYQDSLDCHKIYMSVEDIIEFSVEFSLRGHILFPKNLVYSILFEGDHYFIIAGPKSVVEIGVGTEVTLAFDKFKKYAKESGELEGTEQWLSSIAESYEKLL